MRNKNGIKLVPTTFTNLLIGAILTYKNVLALAIRGLTCSKYPWKGMEADFSTEVFCPNSHYYIKTVSIILIIAHSIAFPIILAVLTRKAGARNEFNDESDPLIAKYGFLFWFTKPCFWFTYLGYFSTEIFFALGPIVFGSVEIFLLCTLIPIILTITFLGVSLAYYSKKMNFLMIILCLYYL